MSALRSAFVGCAWLVAAACRNDRPPDPAPTQETVPQSQPLAPSRFAATGWPDDAGPVLVLRGADQSEVQLVLPELADNTLNDTSSFDLDSLPGAEVALFSREGKVKSTTIVSGGSEESPRGCKTWPTARLASYAGESWRVGLAAKAADVIPIHVWGPSLVPDSVVAARDVIAIAASSQGDSAFRGIPFGVRFLFRLELAGARAVVADVVRRINTEANVREEHVLLVAEKKPGESRYAPAFRETQRGLEDEVRVPEILGAVLLGENRRPAIFVSLEYSEGSRTLLVERLSATQWVLRWRSAYVGC
ncbi:MAG: hypothetical protein H0U64_01715 [Gemmatimonadaceae bacterium]|nr:hypothetical protein [Gemmatimonadaceae bacterium]